MLAIVVSMTEEQFNKSTKSPFIRQMVDSLSPLDADGMPIENLKITTVSGRHTSTGLYHQYVGFGKPDNVADAAVLLPTSDTTLALLVFTQGRIPPVNIDDENNFGGFLEYAEKIRELSRMSDAIRTYGVWTGASLVSVDGIDYIALIYKNGQAMVEQGFKALVPRPVRQPWWKRLFWK